MTYIHYYNNALDNVHWFHDTGLLVIFYLSYIEHRSVIVPFDHWFVFFARTIPTRGSQKVIL